MCKASLLAACSELMEMESAVEAIRSYKQLSLLRCSVCLIHTPGSEVILFTLIIPSLPYQTIMLL